MKNVCVGLILLLFISTGKLQAEPWSSWRGDARGTGQTSSENIPVTWSKEKNIKWRVSLPDAGNSTPVIHGDRIFITQAEEKGKQRSTMCFERSTGKLLWKKGITYDAPEKTHPGNPYCSASPVTDGKIVIVSHGSAGMVAYDFDGNQKWEHDLGPISHIWGNSSSPLLYKNLCIQYHGPGDGGYLIALDKNTGKTVWKYNEPDWDVGVRTDGFGGRDGRGVVGSFSTPILVKSTDGRDELVMSFPMEMQGFDPSTGKNLWSCKGMSPLIYSSPAAQDGIVVAMGGYYGNSIAVKVGGSGDVTGSRLWYLERHNGGIGTGVMKNGHYYYPDGGGNIYCLDTKTGKTNWEAKLPDSGRSWGSLLLAGDHIYSLSQSGMTVVLKANPKALEIIAQNDLGEKTNASLAVSDGEIFLRTYEALWCITKK